MRIFIILFAAACFVSTPCLAQDSPLSPDSGAPSSQIPAGTIRNCNTFYPVSEVSPVTDNVTIISVTVPLSGNLRDGKLVTSSGNPALDAAAIECSKHLYLRHFTSNGTPIEATWTIEIHWTAGRRSYMSVRLKTNCSGMPFTPWNVRTATRPAIVSFQISKDGSVINPKLTQSSGSHMVDSGTIDCVSQYRYPIALHDGQPVEIDWRVRLDWHFRP